MMSDLGYEEDASTTLYGNGILQFSVPKIKIETGKDREYTGCFDIRTCTDCELRGHVYVTDSRMRTSDQAFCGKNLQVPFVYDTTGMGQGDSARGEFCIVTNAGEFFLPYEVFIKGNVPESEMGEIRNLFHFANLAHADWNRAKECFSSPVFPEILVGGGSQYTESYRILLQYGYETGRMDQAMEQFLIMIHKKQPITYECKNTELRFESENIPDTLSIEIQKNGWGYADLEVESCGGIVTVHSRLKEEDFHPDAASLTLEFDKSILYPGENRTKIMQKGVEKPLCEIIVTMRTKENFEDSAVWREKLLRGGITRLYLDYRTGRRPIRESLKKAEKLLAQVRGINELMPALYEAHLKLLRGRSNEAIWLLKNAKRMLKEQDVSMDVYGYFLYLLSMSGDDQQQKASGLLDDYAKEHADLFSLYWSCMHKDNLISENPAAVYRRLRQYFDAGCTSPVLYMEAAFLLLEKDAVLFSVITDFEIQVLLFMDRYALLTDAVTEQIYKVPVSVKKLCPTFIGLCQKHPSKDAKATARLLCRLHMKNGCKSPDAALWLKKGIQSDCRINGLYEAYIRALKLDHRETLPEEVIRYFAYDTALEDRNLAYVYEKVLKQQENINSEYAKRIHTFTIKQLEKGKINRSLAYLYRNILMAEDMNEELMLKLQRLVFANELTLSDANICKSCIVRQKGIKDQVRYPIKNQQAVIYLYTADYTVLFEDMAGTLRQLEDEYRVHSYLDYHSTKHLLKGCRNLSLGEQMYLFDKEPIHSLSDESEFDGIYKNYIWLLQQDALEDVYKKQLAADLINAFWNWEMHQNAEELLEGMQAEDFLPADRAGFVMALISAGFYEKAYKIIMKYGYEKVPIRYLVGICQYMIQKENDTCDEKLLRLAYYVYSEHKFTDDVLQYLNRFFNGSVKQMSEIFRAALSMDVSAYELSGRILEQIIYTQNYTADSMDVFRYYSENGGKKELLGIYLSVSAEEYLLSDKAIDEDIWALLNDLAAEGERISRGTGLALLKYHSTHTENLSEKECHICVELIAECLGDDIYLSFFQAFEAIYPVLELYGEQIYIEYRGKKAQTMLIHYTMERAGSDEASYFTEEMREIYPGIYQKAFRVFWGEKVPYYITAMTEDQEQFCINGDLEQIENDAGTAKGRFRCINEISMALELEDDFAAEELVKKYEAEKYMAAMMFRLK